MISARWSIARYCGQLTVAVAGLAAAGCSGTDSATVPLAHSAPAPEASSTSSLADPQAAAKLHVLAVYRTMWAAQVRAYSSGSITGAGLEDVAGDKALSKVKVTAAYYEDQGVVTQGAPALQPRVTAVDPASRTATISDCIDSSHFVQVDAETRKPLKLTDTNRRHVATYTARIVSGRWLITDFTIARDRTC